MYITNMILQKYVLMLITAAALSESWDLTVRTLGLCIRISLEA
jgi:hypothetical protein